MKSTPFEFRADVLEQSHSVPVLVDFWASWCEPCRILGPVLERLAEKAGGRWRLVKIDTEAFPEIAREYGVMSIPSVKLFSGGKVVDEFTGALPERQIEQWLQKALPSPFAHLVANADALAAAGDGDAAGALYGQVIEKEPGNVRARAGLGKHVLFTTPEEAMRIVEPLEGEQGYAELCDVVRTLAPMLARPESALPDGASREAYGAAVACLRNRDFDGALERFIGVLRTDRQYDGDGSRKACIAIFRLLGEEHEVTLRHRRSFDRAF
ncbi:MAG: tetratricopeptide repeat protein [Chlorobiaceae bacterium]|nr:tetratricopeptide repeat protein [Chlorobiaceae bacterium]